MNPRIFREYDIRGVVHEDLTEASVIELGRGIGTYFRRRKVNRIVIGRDCRLSSASLRDALLKGLLETGMVVTDVGICPTPVLYFSIVHLGEEGGIMITGSHNPPDFNGFKICVGKEAVYGGEIQHIRRLIDRQDYVCGDGMVTYRDTVEAYRDYLVERTVMSGPLTVVLDAGNGTGGVVAVPILRRVGCNVEPIYCDMDGRFPHHHPDPTVEKYLEDLIETVRRVHADVGIGYDGDADRIGVVDNEGNIIWADRLMIVFARDILAHNPGSLVIGDVKCSDTLYDEIRRLGGRPLMWKTGHSLIKDKMKKEGALFAGEMSGHIFFADRYFGFDDAIYASCRLVELMSRTGKTLAQLLEGVARTSVTPELRIECPDDIKGAVVATVKEYFAQRYPINDIDGVRVSFPHGWGLLRASNTQPALVVRCEADHEKALRDITDTMTSRLATTMRELG